ncbi:unnamed protein product [Macrosiphum euphorbiae]|uniref:Uncharacterized protein n=1 Tax=Macrosiphum euphorbiae TaxID=13131 RepID=A0AAV0VZD8_9HEMI|nr:unnamed protein product [Macrosiphum euphorbiae]
MSRKDLSLKEKFAILDKVNNLLHKFFMQEGNENSPSDKLEACAYFVNQIHTKQLRQRTIPTFCIPSTSKY